MSLSDPKTLMKDNMLLLQDLERERKARRIVDLALKQAVDERDSLRKALTEAIDHIEEMVVLLGEVGLRFPHAKIYDVDFEKETDFSYVQAAQCYEKFAKTTRAKFDLPKTNDDDAVNSNPPRNGPPPLPSPA